MKGKFIVTITPPTPNGDLHLGHMSGPFLAADVLSRRLKQQGYDVLLVSYADDYQSYLPRKSKPLRRQPFEFARLVRDMMLNTMALADIDIDCFLQASDSDDYRQAAAHYVTRVADQVVLRTGKVFYCASCECYGYEGFGRGHCNWCGTSSDASQCEHCARMPDINQMPSMTCMSCQQPMVETSVEQYVWRVGENYPAVAQVHKNKPMRQCLSDYLDTALSDVSEVWPITRPGDAGLQLDQLAQQPLHTWFMGLAGYQACVNSYLREYPERGSFAHWWNDQTQLIHFLGFDCSYSHAIGYVAQQLNDPQGPPPGQFITNRFLKLNGDDFSTSRGHAVWIRDMAAHYPADAIRLYTALFAPETAVKNFVQADFDLWFSSFFTPLALAVDAAGHAVLDAVAGDVEADPLDSTEAFYQRWCEHASISQFSMAGMADALCGISDLLLGRSAIQSPKNWLRWAEMAQGLCPQLAAIIYSVRAQ
jgi:methionyl-tRNA synthetase